MKNLIKNILKLSSLTYLLCCLVVITDNVNAQTNNSNSKPNIVFEKTSHDYGVIFAGDNGEVVFNFKNEGNTPLVINNVVASCGCTVPKWSKNPIMPKQSGDIKVEYNTNIIGDIKRSITVSTNDPDKPRIVLILTGKIVKENK
ncbi:MAG: DUF1573 domain-containing protein [Bacteroidales bacterium]|jgi:hypothetical protein|nr:DUF1573 domain-containing protein [Bacteroidales bacterium]MDD4001552.1 DUF1573 domain-containing protein [Bacteroidales bacterium]MDD4528672.1 DUF1573 domain-containing protein [Bacteroidales bacterium]MDD4828944.1 DUF1573 domain-containing protein [Bacteroidales bacterium]